ncbi:hypothetical protein FRB94_012250 [Tulasnella sp. JGI-2019a]|nr:hypothetical protein FRB93_008955 [Tulasnella sp. JGI-2019a]KAG9009303.1 hypothetical protein FRB94_012250 [Tulasnella sp. JGI-2019a]
MLCPRRLVRHIRPTYARFVVSTRSVSFLNIVNANIFELGAVTPIHKSPFSWRIEDEGQSWAIVGDGKDIINKVLLGHLRVSPPPPGGIWPLLSQGDPPQDPFSQVAHASFAMRRRVAGGGFYDYTARYGGVRDEDKITLRQSLQQELDRGEWTDGKDMRKEIERLTEKLEISRFLDLPLIALSNGQTRRAHIVSHLLRDPKVLLLDEPLTGLDVRNRPLLLNILNELDAAHRPRIILGLRKHDAVPDWITHVLVAQHDSVLAGTKDEMKEHLTQNTTEGTAQGSVQGRAPGTTPKRPRTSGKALVDMRKLKVAYADRQVLKEIDWTIREGDRWHLQGANGSGKTTLLSMIMGDHPQSYLQPHFHLFGKPRRQTSTILLQQQIGFVSPELFNAFPRRAGPQGLTVRDVIGTGLHSTFSYRPRTADDEARIDKIISKLGPERWSESTSASPTSNTRTNASFASESFALLPVAEQSLVLVIRALVAQSPLLILDEPFAGMTDKMVETVKEYLREDLLDTQAVIFVTHWEQEVPWPDVRRKLLQDGHATES